MLCEGSNNNIVDKKLFDLCRVMLVLSVGCVIVRTRDHHHSLLRPETISPHWHMPRSLRVNYHNTTLHCFEGSPHIKPQTYSQQSKMIFFKSWQCFRENVTLQAMHNIEFYRQCAESYICQGLCDCEIWPFL